MLEEKARQAINKYKLMQQGEHLLIGVSGGADSMALLHLLCNLRREYNLHLVVAHVDHMFRGEQSYEDYVFVEKYCAEWGVTFEGTRINVPEYIIRTGKSSQVASREVRYKFFEEVMSKYAIHKLVLAHHGDDQLETILMRLTRGATGEARAGIKIKRTLPSYEIIRPFLWASKDEVEDYCRNYSIAYRLDASNEKPVYARNRYRLHVLPFLKQENAQVHEHFQRFSEELLEDEAFLNTLAKERLRAMVLKKDKDVKISIGRLLQTPKPLQRRCIQLILNYLYFERQEDLSATHIESMITLFQSSHPSGEIHLPAGLKVIKSYDECIFTFGHSEPEPYSYTIHIQGETILPNGRKIQAITNQLIYDKSNNIFTADFEDIHLPLTVRTRKNGDRMRVKGLNGSRKVKDIFIDKKIPVTERALWPIVEDANQEIIWIPGLVKSDKEVIKESKSFITLKYV